MAINGRIILSIIFALSLVGVGAYALFEENLAYQREQIWLTGYITQIVYETNTNFLYVEFNHTFTMGFRGPLGDSSTYSVFQSCHTGNIFSVQYSLNDALFTSGKYFYTIHNWTCKA